MRKLLDQIEKELEYNKMKHVQALFRCSNGVPCVKFVSVDTEDYKNRLKKIINEKYVDKLVLIKETDITLLYKVIF